MQVENCDQLKLNKECGRVKQITVVDVNECVNECVCVCVYVLPGHMVDDRGEVGGSVELN